MGRRKATDGSKRAPIGVPPVGEEQLRLALEAAQMLSWDWDLETGAIHWAGAVPGIDLPTSIPRPAEAPFPLVWPGDREKLRLLALECLETHEPTHAEFRVQSPTGLRWVAAVGRAYPNAEGRNTRILGVLREVTARIRIEEELREQREALQVILDSVPALIWYKDAHNHILRANRLAAESTSVPAAVIEGASTYELYPEEAESYHRDDREVIESGLPKLGIVEPLTLASGEKRWVRTDKVPYRNASGEILLHNAVHAIDQAPAGQHQIVLHLTTEPGVVFVRVCDTGVGLPAGDAKQLFEPFFTTRRKGLGMGLSISRSIIESHGGELAAEANRERGASFVFSLPLRD